MDDLNEAQRLAVEHNDGPMLVVAGAGTGKTQVITRRIARLVNQGRAKPEEVLALTFTEKAAAEMLDRLDGLIGWDAARVNVLTFNAFGGQLLSRYGHHLGRSVTGEIMPDLVKALLLRRHIDEAELSYFGPQADIIEFLQATIRYIGALQNAGVNVEQFASFVDKLEPGEDWHPLDIAELRDRANLYRLYEDIKRRTGTIDYHDQIELPLQLLTERPNLARRLQAQYRYVLVDEYQDTNAAQDLLLRAFIPPDGNIFAVGDDDQAIYGFRGARLENILRFAEHFKVPAPVVLTRNYRSTQPILDMAYRLIRHNDPYRLEAELGIDKRLISSLPGPAPEFRAMPTAQAEASEVVRLIAQRLDSGLVPDDIAVLATTHHALKQVARVMRGQGIAYKLTTTVSIFELTELVQLWHLLRWVGLEAEDEAIVQLLRGPFVGWDDSRVREAVQANRHLPGGLEAALERLAEHDQPVSQLLASLAQWRAWARTESVHRLTTRLVIDSGVFDRWAKAAIEKNSGYEQRLAQDFTLLLQHMQQYELGALDPSLAGYLSIFVRPPEIETEELVGETEGVSLLTIHAAKGLEFATVFIVNNTHDAWTETAVGRRESLPPGLVTTELELPPEHEKRRLLYVALTRAKRELFLSMPAFTPAGRFRRLSQFLHEIFAPEELVLPKVVPPDGRAAMDDLRRAANLKLPAPSLKLPFETPDGWLELSPTDIDKYSQCPYEFYLEKVLRIHLPVGPQINFGSLLHNLFSIYYSSRAEGDALSLEALMAILEQRWQASGYRTPVEAEVAYQTARQTLQQFYEREEVVNRQVYGSEVPLVLEIADAKLRLRGRADAIFETADGLEIRDFKTGRKRDPKRLAAEAKDSLQLRTYALALQRSLGQVPARVVLDYIVTGAEGVARLSPQVLANHERKLISIAELIRSRQFTPKADLYHTCMADKYWGSVDEDA